MPRRLFLIETNLKELVREIKAKGAEIYGVYNIIETFVEDADSQKLTQLLSVSELKKKDSQTVYAKADFNVLNDSWRLEKVTERSRITSEEYYQWILGPKFKVIEPKARIVFTHNGLRYSLETNTERNYSVVQIDYTGDAHEEPKALLSAFNAIELLGELFMTLEETFARLHLERKPAGTLEDAVSILPIVETNQKEKAGI